MSNGDVRYSDVNALHALGYPAITRAEAGKAARALIRKFGSPTDAAMRRVNEDEARHADRSELKSRLRRWTDGHESGARRVWVSPKPSKGMNKGWGRLIHDVGHMVFRYRHPGWRPHDHGEERVELEIAQYVRTNTDWLTGTLKEKPAVKPDKVVQLVARLEAWQRKQARAERAIKKLNRRLAYYRKKQTN